MTDYAALPLPADALPEKIRRFGAPDAPKPARMMAAKGLVPVQGADLVTLLAQLASDPDDGLKKTAKESLLKVPPGVLLPACEGELLPGVLDALVDLLKDHADATSRLAANLRTPDDSIARMARRCSERVCEIIATNQQRVLRHPKIIEALYLNKQTRMSTVDRLVELAARNGVNVDGIPSFAAHVEAISGQLIPEATDEPLPTDTMFNDALAEDSDDGDVVDELGPTEAAKEETSEELKAKFKPLAFRIMDMNLSEKIRFAVVGDAAARALLVREPNKLVSMAAISSPSMRDNEVLSIAQSKEVGEHVLRYIGNKKDWLRHYDIKKALIYNPKTPPGVSMNFIGHLRKNDLKNVAKSRGVPQALKRMAKQRLEKSNKN